MARLRHVTSGALVDVPDEKVERLGSEWVPIETAAKAPTRRAAKSEPKADEK